MVAASAWLPYTWRSGAGSMATDSIMRAAILAGSPAARPFDGWEARAAVAAFAARYPHIDFLYDSPSRRLPDIKERLHFFSRYLLMICQEVQMASSVHYG